MSGSAPPGSIVSLGSTAPAVWFTSMASLLACESHLLDKPVAILVHDGATVRPARERACRGGARRAAGRADASAPARGVRRAGAPTGRGLRAAHRARVRRAALDGALRAAGHGQDDAGAARRGTR